MVRAVPPLPLYTYMACTGTTLPVAFTQYEIQMRLRFTASLRMSARLYSMKYGKLICELRY
jgi:hypothetical protein